MTPHWPKLDDAVTGQQISIDEAIRVLNFVRHSDYDGWKARGDVIEAGWGSDPSLRFTKFEAIAIAEKYLRCQLMICRDFNSESTHSESATIAEAVSHINAVT